MTHHYFHKRCELHQVQIENSGCSNNGRAHNHRRWSVKFRLKTTTRFVVAGRWALIQYYVPFSIIVCIRNVGLRMFRICIWNTVLDILRGSLLLFLIGLFGFREIISESKISSVFELKIHPPTDLRWDFKSLIRW